MAESSEKAGREKQWSLWRVVPLVVLLWILMGALPYLLKEQITVIEEFASLGALGDMFGVANSLFSALAFALLIYASWMQREELIETRREVSGQREALEAQVKHLERQGFERTFFEMLAVHRGVLASMSVQPSVGIEAVSKILNIAYEIRVGSNRFSIPGDQDAQVYLAQYESRYWKIEHYIGHYFRGLYSILQFIDSSEVENKRHYARVVRAQLSKPELSLLFHNGLSNHAKKMKPLIEKYALLKHCSESQIKGYAALKILYADSAFGLN